MTKNASLTPPPETDALDADIAMAEERLAMLRRLGELGMMFAEALTRRALEAPETPDANAPAPRLDPADAFAKISRAIRLTIALEAKTHEELRALRSGVVIERKERAKKAAKRAEKDVRERREARMRKAEELVLEAAEREIEDYEAMNDLRDALEQRLQEDVVYWDAGDPPLFDIVKQLCHDLDLNPDWSLWTGEDWGPKAPFEREASSPYRLPSRKPVDHPDGDCAYEQRASP
jgi:ParB-like chromosome segregation protein Spo0J